jgi:hypothetical protein
MNEVRFPLMLTRPKELGSTTLTAYNLTDLQKAMCNELKLSYGYASMCDAFEIVSTMKRRGYFVKTVRVANFEEENS